MKVRAILDDLCKHEIFGEVDAYTYSIEFQKWGLPHMHLLLFLHGDDKIHTAEAVDSTICTEWPDEHS
jgi:hypothetical protein